MLAGWSKVNRRSFRLCSLAPNSTAIFWEPTRGKLTVFLGAVQAGRIARPFWSLLNIWWSSAIQPDVSFWSWITFRITKALLFWLPYRYLNIVCWWFGYLLIARNSIWSNDIGNTSKNLRVPTNCMTRSMRYWPLLNTCWHNRMIHPAFFDYLFLNYYERQLNSQRNDWKL